MIYSTFWPRYWFDSISSPIEKVRGLSSHMIILMYTVGLVSFDSLIHKRLYCRLEGVNCISQHVFTIINRYSVDQAHEIKFFIL